MYCPVGWGCRIHRLHLCRRVRPPNEWPGYDTKQSDGEAPVMLGLCGIQSTLSLQLLPALLLPWMVAPDKALSMGKIELNCIIIIIIMSCRQHGYPWPSLATSPYRSSPLAGLQGYIPYPHRAAICMFELAVLLFLGHMWGSIGVYHLWARPCFSSSVLRVCFV